MLNSKSQLFQVDKLTSSDLMEVTELMDGWEMWVTGGYNQERIEILWFPSNFRAGIAHGGTASWTDASSLEEAMERYFNDDMIN